MKSNLLFLAIFLIILSSCGKDEVIIPKSSFSFRGDTLTSLKMATYDTCSLFSESQNVDSLKWDLGDGRTSSQKKILLSYPKSGTYTITLTAKNKDGQKSNVTKKVLVSDRILKSVYVQSLSWDTVNTNGWPTTSKTDVYFQIQKYTDTFIVNYSLYPNCPIVYTSPIIKDVNYLTYTPFTIPITERIVIDKQLIQFAYPENLNKAYLFSLMAKDKNGNIFCLQNNHGGGGNYFGILKENFSKNEFVIQNGPFSQYLINCDFE